MLRQSIRTFATARPLAKTITEAVKTPIEKGGIASEAALKATEAVDSVAQAAKNLTGTATAQAKGTAQQAEGAAKIAQGEVTKKTEELKQAGQEQLNKLKQ